MTDVKATNITWHEGHVNRPERERLLKQRGATIWFTGLSGSGKSTLAFTLEHELVREGRMAYVLDGEVFWGQDRLDLLDDALKSGRAPYRPEA